MERRKIAVNGSDAHERDDIICGCWMVLAFVVPRGHRSKRHGWNP